MTENNTKLLKDQQMSLKDRRHLMANKMAIIIGKCEWGLRECEKAQDQARFREIRDRLGELNEQFTIIFREILKNERPKE